MANHRPVPAVQVGDVYRAYLRILLAGRNQEVLGDAIGVKRAAVGHILNGRNEVSPSHLQALCERWGIDPSTMFGHLARIAQNLELGLRADEGLRLPPTFGATIEGGGERRPT